MDKQFARILMLSVLLPAGAALAEAIQYERAELSPSDQPAMAQLAVTPPAAVIRETAAEDRRAAEAPPREHDKHTRDLVQSAASEPDRGR